MAQGPASSHAEWIDDVLSTNETLADLLSVTLKRQLRGLDESRPFKDELDYLNTQELCHCLKKHMLSLQFLLFERGYRHLEQGGGDTKSPDRALILQNISKLEALLQRTEQILEAKLQLHRPSPDADASFSPAAEDDDRPLLPRLVRLGNKLGLTEKEKKGLTYIVLAMVGQEFFRADTNSNITAARIGRRMHVMRRYSFEALLYYSGMNVNEAMAFIRRSRLHIVQGLFVVDKINPMVNDYIDIPQETLAVLTGAELTQTELLKIDKTKLSEVVEEETRYNKKNNGSTSAAAAASPSNAKEEEGTKEKEKEKVTVEDTATPSSPASSSPVETVLASPNKAPSSEEASTQETTAAPTDKSNDRDLFELLRQQAQQDKGKAASSSSAEGGPQQEAPKLTLQFLSEEKEIGSDRNDDFAKEITPYKTDVEYLDDQIKWIATKLKIKRMSVRTEDAFGYAYNDSSQTETQLRELRAKERMLKAKCEKRLAITKQNGEWLPRLERLAKACGMDDFEKVVVLTLVGGVISQEINNLNYDYLTGARSSGFTVGTLLQLFCKGFEEEIRARPYFYKAGTLVKEGVVRLSERWGDLMNVKVELDRRMLDFIVGLDTEFNELVEGSHSYFPKVKVDQVVLPDDSKKLILDTVRGFELYKKFRKDLGFEDVISYGNGILLLFFGPSGTGKTMMANALGNTLGKKILLINFTSLGGDFADEVIKFIFREAKLTDSILFFDECEQIFLSREKGGREVNLLLTEIERHDGLIIMATNRAFDLDEAMHRRITLAIEFRQPDPLLRQKIWRAHIPSAMKMEDGIDWKTLAIKYELSGGFIKNAVLSALSTAVNRDPDNVLITQADLEAGSRLQLRGRLCMVDFDRRVVPTRGIEDLITSDSVIKSIQEIINYEKARQVLFGQWGYSEKMCNDQGTTVLFYGSPGVGKTLAAEAVGFETGKPLKVINCAELVSKYVGETGKNIEAVFKEAKTLDAILVFDEAESLFGTRAATTSSSTDRYANLDVGLLLYHMEHFPGIVILTTNLVDAIDSAFYRRLRFMVEFPVPDVKLREKLWRSHVPPHAPLDKDVDFKQLANAFAFAGGNIKNVCFKAAARAALRLEKPIITMADLMDCAEDESKKGSSERMNLQKSALYS